MCVQRCSSRSPGCTEIPAVSHHTAVEMQQLRIVNSPDLLFYVAAEREATGLKEVEEAYETVNMEIR